MNQQDKHPISDYQLERYLLREGTDDELAALDRRLADDPGARTAASGPRAFQRGIASALPTRMDARPDRAKTQAAST